MRIRSAPWGLPHLAPGDAEKVERGNATLRSSVRFLRAAIKAGIPAMMENPAGSQIWWVPPLAKLLRLPGVTSVCFDMCQYNAKFRKRTRVVGWNIVNINRLHRICAGKRGLCSRTNNPHWILEGKAGGREHRTRLAQEYPAAFAAAAALVMLQTIQELPFLQQSI